MDSHLSSQLDFAAAHVDDHLEALYRITRIASISADETRRSDVAQCAAEVQKLMQEVGIEHSEILTLPGKNAHPCVYGELLGAGPDKPTLLLYAHYDVQPIGDADRWKSSPWEPEVRDGRVYARGIVDDKAGFIVHLAAIESYLKTVGSLPVNVKFLVEGEEEIGSTHLEDYIATYAEKLKADVLVLSDTHNHDTGIPSITYALRGILALNLELSALKQSLHSGSFGGPFPNPIEMLSKMIAQLTDEQGKITIPNFYDDVHVMKDHEREKMQALPFDIEQFKHKAGVLPGVELFDYAHPFELMWYQPSLTVTAFESNLVSSAPNQIIQSAKARITLRIVPNINPEKPCFN